jgi:hypothetical protein
MKLPAGLPAPKLNGPSNEHVPGAGPNAAILAPNGSSFLRLQPWYKRNRTGSQLWTHTLPLMLDSKYVAVKLRYPLPSFHSCRPG